MTYGLKCPVFCESWVHGSFGTEGLAMPPLKKYLFPNSCTLFHALSLPTVRWSHNPRPHSDLGFLEDRNKQVDRYECSRVRTAVYCGHSAADRRSPLEPCAQIVAVLPMGALFCSVLLCTTLLCTALHCTALHGHWHTRLHTTRRSRGTKTTARFTG